MIKLTNQDIFYIVTNCYSEWKAITRPVNLYKTQIFSDNTERTLACTSTIFRHLNGDIINLYYTSESELVEIQYPELTNCNPEPALF